MNKTINEKFNEAIEERNKNYFFLGEEHYEKAFKSLTENELLIFYYTNCLNYQAKRAGLILDISHKTVQAHRASAIKKIKDNLENNSEVLIDRLFPIKRIDVNIYNIETYIANKIV